MDMEKEELLQIIDRLNNQVNQLNLENVVLKSKLDILNKKQQENQED
ncbi:hypothetical protein [Methanobrevibacter sp.]